ncbi:MAG TPA: hypothetical protein VF869_05510 [Jatrophihabitantaceae bacterium]
MTKYTRYIDEPDPELTYEVLRARLVEAAQRLGDAYPHLREQDPDEIIRRLYPHLKKDAAA